MKTRPTEALKIIDFWGFYHSVDEEEYIDFDNSTKAVNLAFKEGQSNPKIKQLEWEEGDFCFKSITKFGQYTISKPTSLRGRQVFIVYFNKIYIKSWNTPEEAKAFAQKDFEARVKECLITE